jgi:SOS-response transcriptional repressor LexA
MNNGHKHSLGKIIRHQPKHLIESGDSGLLRESGDKIDLHVLLTNNSPQVRLVPIRTNIMRVSGLHRGAIALVDRSISPSANSLVHVRYNGDEVIRRLIKTDGIWKLIADDPRVEDLIITEDDFVERLGVVTASIIFTQNTFKVHV